MLIIEEQCGRQTLALNPNTAPGYLVEVTGLSKTEWELTGNPAWCLLYVV